jgi:hypothetical protein
MTTQTTAQRAGLLDRVAAGVVELHLTHRDLKSGITEVRAPGRWTPTTDTATAKTYESDVYDAAVMLHSQGLAKGWQVTIRQHGESMDVFEEPVSRDRARAAARAEMAAIAQRHGGSDAST